MSEKIPGGRQRAASEGDPLDDRDDDRGMYCGHSLKWSHKQVSRSAMLTTSGTPNAQSDHRQTGEYDDEDDVSDFNDRRVIGPSERRRKSRKSGSFRSFRKLMNRVGLMKSHSSSGSSNSIPDSDSDGKQWSKNQPRGRDYPDNDGHRTDRELSESSTSRPLITNPSLCGPRWEETPGTVGIYNHGNTCFMNAVLQCLAHTDLFVEYFFEGVYKEDLRNHKNTNTKDTSKGDVTEHLGKLLKCLWSHRYNSDISLNFKNVVGKYNSQYKGSAQHDAQEFFLWLLDRLHEDLNCKTKMKPRSLKSPTVKSDEELAEEALTADNSSFISQLFQALHRSSLICPDCNKHSNTFDTYVCVSLPLPQKCPRPVFITVVPLRREGQLKIGLKMNTYDMVKDLRTQVSEAMHIPFSKLVLCQIYDDGFRTTYRDEQPLSDIHDNEPFLYAIELFEHSNPSTSSDRYETPFIQLIVVHTEKVTSPPGYYRFCSPMVLRVPRDFHYRHLQQEILYEMGNAVKEDVLTKKTNTLFRLRIVDGYPSRPVYLQTDVEMPFFTQAVDRALSYSERNGTPHLKLVAEWEPHIKDCIVIDDEDCITEHTSVHKQRLSQQHAVSTTIDECFTMYTQKEELSGEDAWLCSHCQKQQQGTIKTLGLWSLPNILVLHLKRFKQIGTRRNKLNMMVKFPIEGLEMAHHIINTGHRNITNTDDMTYDLFAVCNHYGNMNGGHYTAFCKNPIDCMWHEFDDTLVKAVSESQVMTKAAYLLFYQRRGLTKQTNQRLHLGNHWVFHMFSNNNNNSISSNGSPVRSGSQSCPTTPTTPKSVHFDTSSPMQIPREASNETRSRSESVGSNQMPSKSILRPLTPESRTSSVSHEEKSPEQTATARWQESNGKSGVKGQSLLARKPSNVPAPSSKMGACVDVPQKSTEESTFTGKRFFEEVRNSRVDPHNDIKFVDNKKHFSMPTVEHDVYNPVPIIELWPILRPDSTFSRLAVKHSFEDSGSQTIDVRNQRSSKVEDKRDFYSLRNNDIKSSEVISHRPRKIEENGLSDVREGQSVGVRDRIKQIEKTEDKRSPQNKQSEDFREKKLDSRETMRIKKSMVSMSAKSANVCDRVKSPDTEPSTKMFHGPDVKKDPNPTVPINGYRKISTGTREKYATIARFQNAQIDELMNISEQSLSRSKTDDNISAKILETSKRLVQPKAVLSAQNYPKCHPKYIRHKNNDIDQRDTVSLSSLGHRSRRRPQSDNISVKSFGYNSYGRRDSSASRDMRYRPHIHRGRQRPSVEIQGPCLKESSV
ncbi:ubiquitin carboxyl-terminal hydrolase 43-like [Gigantopelta aegis]|uniref:ubiquitin carboxyl-terminal hydrolase 43-like n=1 Tax=Gigantopelta aegis TaxID=1735272 RepID=UPI001B8886AD|nr:ubiquitin carboxyl-terminal hydrolase 43-like [Gigantopelta aegis]